MESGMNRWINRLMVTAALAAMVSGTSYAQTPYKVEARWNIGGDGSWDYLTVDSAAKRLYIAHKTKVDVVDLTTGQEIGAVIGLTGSHGVVISPDGKTGFVSDGGANAVVAFDLNNFAQVDKIAAGTGPDGMAFEPVTGTLWAFNGASKNATVIDVATHKVVGTVALPGKPEFPVADGTGTVFVNIEDKNSVVKINARRRLRPLRPGRWLAVNRPRVWLLTPQAPGCSRCATERKWPSPTPKRANRWRRRTSVTDPDATVASTTTMQASLFLRMKTEP